MHSCSFRELEMLRREVETIRKCITNYMGLLFGGVGLAFFTMGARAQEVLSSPSATGTLVPLGIAALALGLIITTVLFISSYKFLSHNRYSGYCKLLTHEHYTLSTNDVADVLAWEVCMDRSRQADFPSGHQKWRDYLRGQNMPQLEGVTPEEVLEQIERVGGPAPPSDEGGHTKGFVAILKGFRGRNDSTSWGFPLYVMMAYAALWALIIAAGWWLIYSSPVRPDIAQTQIATVVTLVGVLSWVPIFGKLWNVMCGSRTVDAYCWKFLPIRYYFLEEYYGLESYRIVR